MMAPSTARIVVVHRSIPADGAPDPRDRQVLRRVLDLAAATNDCVLIAVEPQSGSASWPELSAAGVRVVPAVASLADALHLEAGDAAVIITMDVRFAHEAMSVCPHVPCVLDLADLPFSEIAATRDHVEVAEIPGFETELDRVRERNVDALRRTALVVCTEDTVAAEVRGRAPDARSIVVAPSVPLVEHPSADLDSRRGALFVGSFATVPGSPDERALEALVDGLDERVAAVGIDASPLRRAIRAQLGAVHPPEQLAHALRHCRVAVTGRATGPLAAELTGLGLPSVALDEPGAIDRIRRLLGDDALWHVTSVAQAGIARTMHDPARRRRELLDALRSLGLPLAVDSAPKRTLVPGYRPPSRAGSLAAVREAHERVRREAQPDPLIPWQHALYANLDLPADEAYRRWLAVHHDVDERRPVLEARVRRAVTQPLISICVPVHETDPDILRDAIRSVRGQIYDRWELCIADDGTTRADTRRVLDGLRDDPKVRQVRLEPSGGIVAATNAALELATGAYVAFLDHDDVLQPDALAQVVRLLDADPTLDVVYTDEDKLDALARRVEPFSKPDWSPDLLLSCNYITHLLVVRRALLEDVGGLHAGFDGAQDYDLVLRLTERTDRIGHVAAPVYSWRMSPQSTAADIHAKPEAHAASRRAVEEAIARRGLDAAVDTGFDPTWHRVRRQIRHRPLVTVVIPTRDRLDLLAPCVDLLRNTVDHEHLELLVVDNESVEPATLHYLEHFDGRVVRYPHRFNYARQMNLAAQEASGEVLLLLNNDVRPTSQAWFDALLEHALRPEVGAVGARLRFPSGKPQHEGVVLNAAGVALNLDSGPWAVLGENIRDTAAVTAACMMIRTSVWHAVGGMDERLRVAYNDVDLCLRIGERGWRILYTPFAELEHAESSSRGSLHPEIDEAFYQRRWGPPRSTADPFFTTAVELLEPFSPRL